MSTLELNKLPKILLSSLLVKASALVWMGLNGFPKMTADAIVFKQPAYMYLMSGAFTIPTFSGRLPHAGEIFAAHAPLYTYVNVFAFWLFGFNIYASLGLDLLIHLVLTATLSFILWRLSGSQLLSGMFLLLSTFILLPLGRPEELGSLLSVCALCVAWLSSRTRYLSVVLVALSFATSPVQGALGMIVLSAIEALRRGLNKGWLLFMLKAFCGIVLILCAMWLPAISWRVSDGLEQFALASRIRSQPSFLSLFTGSPIEAFVVFSLVVMTLLVGLYVVLRRERLEAMTDRELTLVKAITFSLPFCLAIPIVLQRGLYDYRLLTYICLASSLFICHRLIRVYRHKANVRRKRIFLTALLALLLVVGVVANYNIVRFVLVPFVWGPDSAKYSDGIARIHDLVPKEATVGGDAALWFSITDGRPFYAVRWIGDAYWPEYLVSTTFWGSGGKPYVLTERRWEARIDTQYQELGKPELDLGVNRFLRIPIVGAQLAISRSSNDWSVRVWRRKSP